MKCVGVKEAKAHLSALCADAAKGEVVIITKNNTSSGQGFRLVPVSQPLPPPKGFGMFADRFKDLPSDYWTNPQYEHEFIDLFEDEE